MQQDQGIQSLSYITYPSLNHFACYRRPLIEFQSVYIKCIMKFFLRCWNVFGNSQVLKHKDSKISLFFLSAWKITEKGMGSKFFYQIPLMKSVTHNTFIHLYFILTVVISYFICLGYYLSYFSSYCNGTRWYYYLILILH